MDLPTVLVLFEDVKFTRHVFVCVPGNSLFSSVGPLREYQSWSVTRYSRSPL
ncbi:MAG: hypothetical protein M3Z54_02565 [Gemmatimonadota bacterium]|nr:hypothetical protein [Gemmatimonadota bacterium]